MGGQRFTAHSSRQVTAVRHAERHAHVGRSVEKGTGSCAHSGRRAKYSGPRAWVSDPPSCFSFFIFSISTCTRHAPPARRLSWHLLRRASPTATRSTRGTSDACPRLRALQRVAAPRREGGAPRGPRPPPRCRGTGADPAGRSIRRPVARSLFRSHLAGGASHRRRTEHNLPSEWMLLSHTDARTWFVVARPSYERVLVPSAVPGPVCGFSSIHHRSSRLFSGTLLSGRHLPPPPPPPALMMRRTPRTTSPRHPPRASSASEASPSTSSTPRPCSWAFSPFAGSRRFRQHSRSPAPQMGPVGPSRYSYCSPSHVMPFASISQGSHRVSVTRRARALGLADIARHVAGCLLKAAKNRV